jgi:hypothetical protein
LKRHETGVDFDCSLSINRIAAGYDLRPQNPIAFKLGILWARFDVGSFDTLAVFSGIHATIVVVIEANAVNE